MPKMFLSKTEPLHTCNEKTCENCALQEKVVCHFTLGWLVRFIFSVVPAAGVGIVFFSQHHPWMIAAWLSMFIAYFGFIEIRVMCSHCPHYGEPSLSSLKCWANYGSPKLWRFRPEPMTKIEKAVFYAGFIVIFLFPLPFYILSKAYVFLGLYIVLFWLAKELLTRGFCVRCINFACPLNRVDEETRSAFFEKNPIFKEKYEH